MKTPTGTQPRTRTPQQTQSTTASPSLDWRKEITYKDGMQIQDAGIPAEQANGVTSNAVKLCIWNHKHTAVTISLFQTPHTDEYLIHVDNGKQNYVDTTLESRIDARNHIAELKAKITP